MESDFTSMQKEFGEMFYQVRRVIASKGIDPTELKTLISDCYLDLRPQLKHIKTVDNVLDVVRRKCSLIDVHCLEAIIETFNITEALSYLNAYNKAKKDFCQRMTVKLCDSQSLQVVRTPIRLTSETVVFVLDWDPDEITLQDIKVLLSAINSNFLLVEKVGPGQSVVISCYCPAEYTASLIIAVFKKIEILQKNRLKEFIVGNCIIWMYNKVSHSAA